MNQWHTKEVTEILDAFQSREHGCARPLARQIPAVWFLAKGAFAYYFDFKYSL